MISEKTKKFFCGRKGQMKRIEKACRGVDNIVWVHSASYGEFEEARPVIAKIRELKPEVKILVTFFSPSGYEYLKGDPIADFIFYLPLDLPGNARRFIKAVKPIKVIVSISDYWLGFLNELRRRKIDTYLISGRFTPDMIYFNPLGIMYKRAFKKCFKTIMVKDRASLDVLKKNGVENVIIAGDPRMDRVIAVASESWGNPVVDGWLDGNKAFVAGSTLEIGDNALIERLALEHPDTKFLIIPHEIGLEDIEPIAKALEGRCALYSEVLNSKANIKGIQVLIVDAIGMLSRLYRYGFAAYVGGGFDGSPHSVVEPASYGIPVSYGPQFGSHYHCEYLCECGGGKAVSNYKELEAWFDEVSADPSVRGAAARRYCEEGSGSAEKTANIILYGN